MKTLKLMALIALVGYGSSALALPNPFSKKLDRKEVDAIKARAQTADFKQVEADIKNLQKHGNTKAAGHTQAILVRRKAELAVQEAAAAQKSQADVVAKQVQLAKAQEMEKRQQLAAELSAEKAETTQTLAQQWQTQGEAMYKKAAQPEQTTEPVAAPAEKEEQSTMSSEDKEKAHAAGMAYAADLLKRAKAAYTPAARAKLSAEIEAEQQAIVEEYKKEKAPTIEERSTPEQKLLRQRWDERDDALNAALFAFPNTID